MLYVIYIYYIYIYIYSGNELKHFFFKDNDNSNSNNNNNNNIVINNCIRTGDKYITHACTNTHSFIHSFVRLPVECLYVVC